MTTRKVSPGGRKDTATVTCRRCQQVQTLSNLTVWPVVCPQCQGPVAPAWWWRERGNTAKAASST